MKTKIEQFTAKNPNPVLSVEKDGTVLYSNVAGEPLLHEWGVRVGEKLPSFIGDFVQRVISRNSSEKMEVKAGKRVYLVTFHPLPEEKCVNIYGFDISDHKEFEEKLQESEAWEMANLELADIVDTQAIQSFMDDFYKLAHIPMSLVDLKGNVLVGVGWQDICTKFHRVHPEACKHCVESDTKLSAGVTLGEFKLYRCKNNMWDIATPIMMRDQQVGILFSGQFFFEDEPLEYKLFRSQARQYGFNEEEYIAALEKVPRLSREAVDTGMAFLTKLADMISQLSYSNIKLAQSLAERDALVDSLQEIEKRERARSDELAVVLDAVPVTVFIAHDPQALQITGNRLSYEWIHVPVGTNFSKSAPEGERPEMFNLFKDGVEMQPADMPSQMAAAGIEVNNCELDIVSADGKIRHVLGNARPLRDEQGNLSGSISAFIDITERKKAEEAIRLSNIYNRSLIEASLDPLVTIRLDGKITDVNSATEQVTGYSRNELIGTDFSDYFTEPEKASKGYHQVFMHGEVRNYPLEIRHKDGHITPVLYNASVYRDENGKVIGVFAAARDITERQKAEEALRESEKRERARSDELAVVLDAVPVAVYITHDPHALKITGNRLSCEWQKVPLGTNFSKSAPEGERPEMFSLFRDGVEMVPEDMPSQMAAAGREINNCELDIVSTDGKIRHVLGNARPLRDEQGNLRGSISAFIDITERKRAETKLEETLENLENLVKERTAELEKAYASLKESEQGLAEAQKMAHIGNWDWNLVTGEIYWSDELYSIFGLTPQKFGLPYNDVLNYIHPDNRGDVDNAVKGAFKGKPYNIDYRIVPADGAERIVHAQGEIIFNDENTPVKMKGILQDITERKKAEEKIQYLANIVESSNDAIVTESLDGIITSWNKGAEHIYGYSAEEIMGKSVSILEPDNLKGEIKKLIEKVKQREKVQHYRTLRLKKDGTIINVSVTYSPVFDASGQLMAISVIGRDITGQTNAQKLLEKAEEARKKEIHHRIKNNLQVISSLLDLQAEKFRNIECVENSEVLSAFGESQDRVMSIALIHEELHEGRGTDTLNFSPYLERLVKNLFQTYRLGNAHTRLNIELEENIFFDTDIAVPLGIIINELVSNSLKHAFIGRDKGEIRIKLHREEKGEYKKEGCKDTSFTLTISDNGVGIPENLDIEDLDSLGLQLITTLVDQLDGELELKKNNGTEFTIRFSIKETDKQIEPDK